MKFLTYKNENNDFKLICFYQSMKTTSFISRDPDMASVKKSDI